MRYEDLSASTLLDDGVGYFSQFGYPCIYTIRPGPDVQHGLLSELFEPEILCEYCTAESNGRAPPAQDPCKQVACKRNH